MSIVEANPIYIVVQYKKNSENYFYIIKAEHPGKIYFTTSTGSLITKNFIEKHLMDKEDTKKSIQMVLRTLNNASTFLNTITNLNISNFSDPKDLNKKLS